MQPTAPPASPRPQEPALTWGPPQCPVCTGVLVPLRDQYRCTRCFFSLCVGCENLEADAAGADD